MVYWESIQNHSLKSCRLYSTAMKTTKKPHTLTSMTFKFPVNRHFIAVCVDIITSQPVHLHARHHYLHRPIDDMYVKSTPVCEGLWRYRNFLGTYSGMIGPLCIQDNYKYNNNNPGIYITKQKFWSKSNSSYNPIPITILYASKLCSQMQRFQASP